MTDNLDYVEFGSDVHAALLGLRKAGKDDKIEHEGWTLVDLTAFGPGAREEFLLETLRQKVATLNSGPPPAVQSDDPRQPHYAPDMWVPPENVYV